MGKLQNCSRGPQSAARTSHFCTQCLRFSSVLTAWLRRTKGYFYLINEISAWSVTGKANFLERNLRTFWLHRDLRMRSGIVLVTPPVSLARCFRNGFPRCSGCSSNGSPLRTVFLYRFHCIALLGVCVQRLSPRTSGDFSLASIWIWGKKIHLFFVFFSKRL